MLPSSKRGVALLRQLLEAGHAEIRRRTPFAVPGLSRFANCDTGGRLAAEMASDWQSLETLDRLHTRVFSPLMISNANWLDGICLLIVAHVRVCGNGIEMAGGGREGKTRFTCIARV